MPLLARPTSCSRSKLLAALFATLCASCSSDSELPGKQEVARQLESGCSLVSMADFELADNADAEGREFITRYEADCVSEGDHRPKRIAGMMSFREERGSLGSRRWALGENTLLADAETPSAAPNANDAIDNTYSDAPACNALTHRIAEEVLPCLQRVKPELAQHLQVAIGDRQHAPRLRSDLAESADVLSQVEEECQTHWQQVLHQLDSKAAEGECLLKD